MRPLHASARAWWHIFNPQDPTGPGSCGGSRSGEILDAADLSPDWALLLLQPRTVPEGLDERTALVLAYARPLALLDKRTGAVNQLAQDPPRRLLPAARSGGDGVRAHPQSLQPRVGHGRTSVSFA